MQANVQCGLRNSQPRCPPVPHGARFYAFPAHPRNARQAQRSEQTHRAPPPKQRCISPESGGTHHAHMCRHTRVSANQGQDVLQSKPALSGASPGAKGADGGGRRGRGRRGTGTGPRSPAPAGGHGTSITRSPAGQCRARPLVPMTTCDLFRSPCQENEGRGNERALSLLAAFARR